MKLSLALMIGVATIATIAIADARGGPQRGSPGGFRGGAPAPRSFAPAPRMGGPVFRNAPGPMVGRNFGSAPGYRPSFGQRPTTLPAYNHNRPVFGHGGPGRGFVHGFVRGYGRGFDRGFQRGQGGYGYRGYNNEYISNNAVSSVSVYAPTDYFSYNSGPSFNLNLSYQNYQNYQNYQGQGQGYYYDPNQDQMYDPENSTDMMEPENQESESDYSDK